MGLNIDVIILSNGKDQNLVKLTTQTIQSLIASEDPYKVHFKVLVIESNSILKPFQYKNSKTIYPESKFGFHKYLNIGVKQTSSDLICFCNNDLIFHKGWASAIISALRVDCEIYSASTFCPNFHSKKSAEIPNKINYGYKNGVLFTGWCFMVKRSVFDTLGMFDEKFTFWHADDDFRLTLKKNELKNALIKSSKVTHLGSETLNKEQDKEQHKLKYQANAYYRYKWEHKKFWKYSLHRIKYIFNSWLRTYRKNANNLS